MKRLLLIILATVFLTAAETPLDEASTKDLEKLQGDWAVLSMTRDGEKIPDDDAQAIFRTVKGTQYTVFRFDKAIGKGTFTLDATKTPKTIDALAANSPKEKVMRGIYEISGDTYKVCFGAPGKDRPTEMTAKEGTGHTLTVWQREKK